jgi:hypothetical protein
MPTIEELLGEETSTEKNASVNKDELNKLAAEIGLLEETVASSDKPIIKEAKMLHELYLDSYPGDADLLGQEKTANLDKEAALIEEAMGEYAHDVFTSCVEGHVEKMAAELVEAHVTDETHPQSMQNNEDTSEKKIDTTPQIQDQLMGTNPKGTVGEFEMRPGPNGEQIKAAALRKHILKVQLGI